MSAVDVATGVRAGTIAAIGRALSAVEVGGESRAAILDALGPVPRIPVVALTGPPGAGKSTLAGAIVDRWCDASRRVAAVLVDPSSPLTGGAVLGDRVRMRHRADGRLFVRSLASRHRRDGLAPAIADAVVVLAAAGSDIALLETVGSGQIQSGAIDAADLVVLVQPPGLGDEVQAMKAGAIELADCFVVSKVDQPGAEATALVLEQMVQRSNRPDRPVWRCSTVRDEGVDDVAARVLAAISARCAERTDVAEVAAVAARLRAAIQTIVDDALGSQHGEDLIERLATDVRDGLLTLDEAPWLALATLHDA